MSSFAEMECERKEEKQQEEIEAKEEIAAVEQSHHIHRASNDIKVLLKV